MEREIDKVIAALNEWKDASERRKIFAMLVDEDGNIATISKGKFLSLSLACALIKDERLFSICGSALDLATYNKIETANAKGLEEE